MMGHLTVIGTLVLEKDKLLNIAMTQRLQNGNGMERLLLAIPLIHKQINVDAVLTAVNIIWDGPSALNNFSMMAYLSPIGIVTTTPMVLSLKIPNQASLTRKTTHGRIAVM